MTISEKLLHLASSMSVAAFALKCGENASTMSGWIKGRGTPSPRCLLAIARTLDVDLEWLLDDAAGLPVVHRTAGRTRSHTLSRLLDAACQESASIGCSGEQLARHVIREGCELLSGDCLMNALAGVTVSVTRQLLVVRSEVTGRVRDDYEWIAGLNQEARFKEIGGALIERSKRVAFGADPAFMALDRAGSEAAHG